jgi:hypothetical protein
MKRIHLISISLFLMSCAIFIPGYSDFSSGKKLSTTNLFLLIFIDGQYLKLNTSLINEELLLLSKI